MAGSARGTSQAFCVSSCVPGVRPGGGAARGATTPRWPGSGFIAGGRVDRVVLPDAGDGRWTGAPKGGAGLGGDLDRQQRSRCAWACTSAEGGTVLRGK